MIIIIKQGITSIEKKMYISNKLTDRVKKIFLFLLIHYSI